MNTKIPILNCSEVAELEKRLLKTNQAEEEALFCAGRKIGEEILKDFSELGKLKKNGNILVLCGGGHNAGDAIVAAEAIWEAHPNLSVHIILLKPLAECKSLLQKVIRATQTKLKSKFSISDWTPKAKKELAEKTYEVAIDGLLGLSYCPPLREPYNEVIQWFNSLVKSQVRLIASVDLPSGFSPINQCMGIDCDIVYMPGVPKRELFSRFFRKHPKQLRFLDLGFFDNKKPDVNSSFLINEAALLTDYPSIRSANSDKRSHGHIFILAGSQAMPGALFLSTESALKSGAGLVTAFSPSSVASSGSIRLPEAMWHTISPRADGSLDSGCTESILSLSARATSLLVGPGLPRDETTQDTLSQLILKTEVPLVLDASALQPKILDAVKQRDNSQFPVVITPHLGEFRRIFPDADPYSEDIIKQICEKYHIVCLLKGSASLVADKNRISYSIGSSPVLARGGSGDLLSGMVASLLGQEVDDPFDAVCLALAWQASASRLLAQKRGQQAVRVSEFLDFYPSAIRDQE